MEPLISASSLRVDVAGVPAIDGLSLTSTAERVLVLGAATALFEAAAGLRPTARGSLRIEGVSPVDALRAQLAAGAPLDPPLPPAWTARQYVAWSARLAQHGRGAARELAAEALARVKIGTVADARLGTASTVVRRATVLAAALATGAKTLLVEDPVAGLPAEQAAPFTRALVRALADRRSIFFAGRVPLESPIALAADEAIVVHGAHVAAQGAPAEIAAAERSFSVRIGGDVRSFTDAVTEQGGRLLADAAAPAHLTVELGPLGTRDLLRIAQASNAVVLELRPIAHAFA